MFWLRWEKLSSTSQKMRAMEDTLSKANKAYPDCSAMASKLRAMTQNTEDQLRAQKNQASYLIQLAASTFPKGLHCLSMRLTTQYFTLKPEDRQFPNRINVRKEDLYHYAIFSDNILACAVAVNSTVSSSKVIIICDFSAILSFSLLMCILMLEYIFWYCSSVFCMHLSSLIGLYIGHTSQNLTKILACACTRTILPMHVQDGCCIM